MNEILTAPMKLKTLLQNIQRLSRKPLVERNGFDQFWVALYIVYELFLMAQNF